MGSGNLNSNCESEEKGAQKISVAHQINDLEYAGQKTDSFIVDIERFSSHVSDKDVNVNSRVKLQRSLSRKGSIQRGSEKNSNSSVINDNNLVAASPRAALHGTSTPEKSMLVTLGANDHSGNSQLHNAITIITGNSGGATATESKIGGRRFSIRRSSLPWTIIDPRRILFFFATLSSMGTILLIYFTLSMSKLNGEDNGLN